MSENIQPKSKIGGKRAGAGRKLGSATKKTREIADAAINAGITPLEYMLNVMRNNEIETDLRFEAAKAAAPYIHPRLAAIAHEISGSLDLGIADAIRQVMAERNK